MYDVISTCLWPKSRSAEAVTLFSKSLALDSRNASAYESSVDNMSIEALTTVQGVSSERINMRYDEIDSLLVSAKGMMLEVVLDGVSGFFLVLESFRNNLVLLTPALQKKRVDRTAIRDVLCAPFEKNIHSELDGIVDVFPKSRHNKIRRTLLNFHLADEKINIGWLFRSLPSASLWSQLRHLGLAGLVWRLLFSHSLAFALWIVAWWLIGLTALEGNFDVGWWQAWLLLLVSIAYLQALSGWWQTRFLSGAAVIFKRRILHGVFRLDRDKVHAEGSGQLLGKVLETEAVESLAFNGGIAALLAIVEVIGSILVLSFGANASGHVFFLMLWIALAIVLVWWYVYRRRAWTIARLGLTHHLIDQMLGHRTRSVQQPMNEWHKGEDETLQHYNDRSKDMDRVAVVLTTLIARGWLITALILLAPTLLAATPESVVLLAIIMGGSLLAYSALQKCTQGMMQLAAAAIAWRQVAPIYNAGKVEPESHVHTNRVAASKTVLFAQNLSFRYRKQSQSVLQNIDLQINQGDKILLEGSSGSGKSTLANLITGQRTPDSGLLLLNGLDRYSLGSAWRKFATYVPQFHENHVFSESLAFNLLMGRNWPPTQEDFEKVVILCQELGLGELLSRMPNGLWQIVGESGWRLSHGERSRIFLARALLQDASLTVVDESFAALDPENLAHAIRCVVSRARSLLVIAHP